MATLYDCRTCGGRFPLAEMAKSRRNGEWRLYPRCLGCNRIRKRKQERQRASAPRGADGTLVEAVLDSDPSPARLLGDMLREDRDRWGFDFPTAWAENVTFVLRHIVRPSERELWREAFESQRNAWQAAWSNTPGPGSQLSPALVHELAGARASALLAA